MTASHLAFACREPEADARLGINYHRPAAPAAALATMATPSATGDWILNGVKDCVANAPVARLIAVEVLLAGQVRRGAGAGGHARTDRAAAGECLASRLLRYARIEELPRPG